MIEAVDRPRRIATLASLKGRERLLSQTIASLAPQVDAICVYLNGHEQIPECLRAPKALHVVRSSEAGWRGPEAKLWFWDRKAFAAGPAWRDDDLAIVCDDDIVYPSNYVDRMAALVAEHPAAVACVHGSIVMEPFHRYESDRLVANVIMSLLQPVRVHIAGTGTIAFRRGAVDYSVGDDTKWSLSLDVSFALWAKARGVELWSIDRRDRWLSPLVIPGKGTSIYRERVGANAADVESALIAAACPWPILPDADGALLPRGQTPPGGGTYNPSAALPVEVAAWLRKTLSDRRMPAPFVVELGAGHGSDRLFQCLPPGARMTCIEHDEKFLRVARRATVVHAPIRDGWYNPERVAPAIDRRPDVVIVDGPPGRIGRSGLLEHMDLFGDAPIWIVDDVHREPDAANARDIAARLGRPIVRHECHGGRAFATICAEAA